MKNVPGQNSLKRVWKIGPVLLLASVLLSGCALSNRGVMTELQADENGRLVHTIVEKADKSYEVSELEQYIKDEIAAYTGVPAEKTDTSEKASSKNAASASSGSAGIELQSCRVKDGNIQIRIDYDSCTDYMQFNGTRCFFGTIRDAEEEGYTFDGIFLNEKGKQDEDANATISERASEWKVLIVEEPMRVRVPDKILYTSGNMKTTGRTTAVYSGGQDAGTSSSAGEAAQSSSSSGEDVPEKTKKNGTAATPEQFVIDDFDLAYVIFK